MEFVQLTLERIGAGTEAGSVIEEFYEELAILAAKVADEDRFGRKGKLTLTLELERSGDAIVAAGAVQVKSPAKKRKASVGYFSNGQLLTQNAEQLAIPFTRSDVADRLAAELDRRAAKRIERDAEDHDPDTGEIRKPRRSPKTVATVQAKSAAVAGDNEDSEGDDE